MLLSFLFPSFYLGSMSRVFTKWIVNRSNATKKQLLCARDAENTNRTNRINRRESQKTPSGLLECSEYIKKGHSGAITCTSCILLRLTISIWIVERSTYARICCFVHLTLARIVVRHDDRRQIIQLKIDAYMLYYCHWALQQKQKIANAARLSSQHEFAGCVCSPAWSSNFSAAKKSQIAHIDYIK